MYTDANPFVTEDQMLGLCWEVGCCIGVFFNSKIAQPSTKWCKSHSGEWKNLGAEKQGSGVSAGLSEIYLSEASQPHMLRAFAISMLIPRTNCRRYSGATYRLMHFVTSWGFRRLTPRSSTLLGSFSECCSIVLSQLHFLAGSLVNFVSIIGKTLRIPTLTFIRTSIDERANGIAMMISQTAWGCFARESYKQSSCLQNGGVANIWISYWGLLIS